MPIEILMPALSPTMEEGKLAKWLKNEGDKVAAGDVIAEIETDKATMEVEAVDEGTLGKILVPAGTEGVKVNTPIAVLAVDGEDVDEPRRAASAQAEPPRRSADAGAEGRAKRADGSRSAKKAPRRLRRRAARPKSPPIPTIPGRHRDGAR